MKNKTYDISKKIFSILPYVASFIIGLGKIWNLAWASSVAGTISLVGGLGLSVLQVLSNKYFQKHDIVDALEGKITFINPELNQLPEDEEE